MILSPAPLPRFVTVAKVHHQYAGPRPHGLEGAIVHFDAGRARFPGKADELEQGALATLAYGATSGFAYVTVSRGGTIYLPANMDWQAWGSHAGASKCPATGRSGVSRFYVGFEVNSPGWVYPTADPNLFVPWFEAVRGANGMVRVDKAGRATSKNQNGELYHRDEVRIMPAAQGNIHKGAYVPFTPAQMDSLVDALLWLKRQYPQSFGLNRVFGHDEVAPTRKLDPGGSLGWNGPMTMAAFRAELLKREEDAAK
jgi:hypothetical protein